MKAQAKPFALCIDNSDYYFVFVDFPSGVRKKILALQGIA